MSGKGALGFGLAILLAGALAVGLWLYWPARPARPTVAVGAPSVLLLTLDTLRSDRLSLYGYEKETSPFLDRLAADGVIFDRAYATSNITKPSHASILTGLYPKHHGITDNNEAVLHPAIVTLAERFQTAGYRTLGAVATNLLDGARSGLDQGFEVYLDSSSSQRRAGAVVKAALEGFDELGEGPYFAWLHFYDPHIPYRAPGGCGDRFRDRDAPPIDLPIASDRGLSKGSIPASSALGNERDPADYSAAYDCEIRYLDGVLAELFQELRQRGRLDHTVVAVTADHGEMLGEEGIYYSHASLHEPVVRVPMILVAPGLTPGRTSTVVENLDLGPTLLDLVGLPVPQDLDATSLLPILEDPTAGDGLAYSHHSHGVMISLRDPERALLVPIPSDEEEIITPFHRFDRATYLRFIDGDQPRLYRIDGSGRLSPALYDEDDDETHRLTRQLAHWIRPSRELPAPVTVDLTEEQIRQLQALGYL